VASGIVKAMKISPRKRSKAIKLGDPSLLRFEMSHAADFWEIPCPVQKRDRKSGAKKRSQMETELERLSRAAL
jgi:DNA (cytosine-5)-methyltransferase 1